MNYNEFQKIMSSYPVFSVREIEKQFPGFDKRRLVEWQEKGYIQKLRNRFYCFSDIKTTEPFLYYVANMLYHPSYISLETALARYGFIPEGVFQILSCSTLKTQTFDTLRGIFVYRNIKSKLFFGYTLEQWEDRHYAIAEPEKTLIDYLYLHAEVQTISDIEALRWNTVAINERISLKKLHMYQSYIASQALDRRLLLLKEVLHVKA